MMPKTGLNQLVCSLRRTVEAHRLDGQTDATLLERFRLTGDPVAFEAVVRRHGERVLAACRKVLTDAADVEDAFQATFLVLLREAKGIRNQRALGGWLYGVAHRIALQARCRAARRSRIEARQARTPAQQSPDLCWREACVILHEELDRLPDTYRLPLLLCYLEGKSRDEAAQQLGVKVDVVRGLLERGRDRLRTRLTKRGITLSAGLLAVVTRSVNAYGPTEPLLQATLKAATTGRVPAKVAALLHSAAPSAILGKVKLAAVAVLALVLMTGAVGLGLSRMPPDVPPAKGKEAPAAADEKKSAEVAKDEALEAVECRGRVLDPDGKAVVGAKVTFYQRPPKNELPDFFPEPATGTTDADGQFRFPAAVHPDAPNRGYQPDVVLVAHVPGYGPAALEAYSADALKDKTLHLVKDDVPIEGRILDLEGKPIAGATVRPVAVVVNAANDLGPWIKARAENKWAELADEYKTNTVFATTAAGLTPKAVTDDAGKFKLTGFGRQRIVVLRVDGPTVETRLLNVLTRRGPAIQETYTPQTGVPSLARPQTNTFHGATFDFVPGVGLTVEGVVSDRETGKPVAGVTVHRAIDYDFGWAQDELTTTTDAEGRYRLAGLPWRGGQRLEFRPAAGQPYFLADRTCAVSEIGKPAKLDVGLTRGVVVKGRVTDKATGKPVQAVVQYFALGDNPHVADVKGFAGSRAVSSRKDGSFQLVALPGRGIVAGKTDNMGRGRYLFGQGADDIKGFDPKQDFFETAPYLLFGWDFDAVAGIEPDTKAESLTCDLRFERGKTVKGTILDDAGKPLTGISIHGPFGASVNVRDLPTAEFTLTAVNSSKPAAYFFLHPKKKLAAAVIVKGDEGEGVTVKLQPAATVTGRLLTGDGEPVRNAQISVRVEAGQLNLARSWNGMYWAGTDAEGRFTLEGLLAEVRLGANVTHKDAGVADLFQKVKLEPGERRDLGDVKVKWLRD
jgi:RNA polymerase sigma factor (sigma-70 family)